MRTFAAVLFLACGTPDFVPVTIEMSDALEKFLLFASATKKLNPACSTNCEMGAALEDGGCSEILITSGNMVCTPGGGLWYPFKGVKPSGRAIVSPPKYVSPGSELLVYVLPDDQVCRATFAVPAGEMRIVATREADAGCSFSYR